MIHVKPSAARVIQPVPVLVIDAVIIIEDDGWRAHPGWEAAIHDVIHALLADEAGAALTPAALTLMLSSDAHVSTLNGTFRHNDGPTNVLSFPALSHAALGVAEAGERPYLGDIIIARETVEREAADLGISMRHHVQHLALHGVLHLLGHDHMTDRDAVVMETIETRVLARLDVADPYAVDP